MHILSKIDLHIENNQDYQLKLIFIETNQYKYSNKSIYIQKINQYCDKSINQDNLMNIEINR